MSRSFYGSPIVLAIQCDDPQYFISWIHHFMETHFATNKTSTHCGVLNFDNLPNLIYGNIGKKISFTFKIAHKGIEIKLMLTFNLWSNKSQAEHVCMWPIASIIPPELRTLHMQLCVSQGAGGPLAPAPTPARGHRHCTGVGNKAMEDPSRASQEHLWNFCKGCLGDGPLLQSTGMCLVSKQWDNFL